MRLREIIDKKMTLSFEVYPPKSDMPVEPLIEVLDKFSHFSPDFISCTYGAGGTNKGRSTEICDAITSRNIECLTHFTCIGNSKEQVKASLSEYLDLGVKNVLALRGEYPQGWEGTRGDFEYATQLIEYIKKIYPEFCITAACYPEKHINCDTMEADITHLRMKQDAGAEMLISQLCYNVDAYERYIERIRKAGVNIPVAVGILPVLNSNGIKRMTLTNGCSIPAELSTILGKYGENLEDLKKAGIEYTIKLIHEYINIGVGGIHLYTLNKYEDVAQILYGIGRKPKIN